MKLRPYQRQVCVEGSKILKEKRILYLCLECRTGKTLISLSIAKELKYKNVLFLTKKMAIPSINSDYELLAPNFSLTVTNYEQVGKLKPDYDLIIVDEAHNMGAYPKPSKRTASIKKLVGKTDLILLSATPSPEGYSQIYHQFWLSDNSPFNQYKNFYAWAKAGYVNIQMLKRGGVYFNDYTKGLPEKIKPVITPYMLNLTQSEAGFNTEIEEEVIYMQMPSSISQLERILARDRYYEFADGKEAIVCDSPIKLQTKIHQVSSGTVITESGKHVILSDEKAKFIKETYPTEHIAIFYVYKSELEALCETFKGEWTDNPSEFNSFKFRVFLGQVKSASQGVDLRTADYLIFYNIVFSAVTYLQARERLQSKDREKPAYIRWIFREGGIENDIYQIVQQKMDYTTSYFRNYVDKMDA